MPTMNADEFIALAQEINRGLTSIADAGKRARASEYAVFMMDVIGCQNGLLERVMSIKGIPGLVVIDADGRPVGKHKALLPPVVACTVPDVAYAVNPPRGG